MFRIGSGLWVDWHISISTLDPKKSSKLYWDKKIGPNGLFAIGASDHVTLEIMVLSLDPDDYDVVFVGTMHHQYLHFDGGSNKLTETITVSSRSTQIASYNIHHAGNNPLKKEVFEMEYFTTEICTLGGQMGPFYPHPCLIHIPVK